MYLYERPKNAVEARVEVANGPGVQVLQVAIEQSAGEPKLVLVGPWP